jgi:hypothetical protein
MKRIALLVISGFAVIFAGAVSALPATGDVLPTIHIERVDGQDRALPGGPLPCLIQYEDKEAQQQNARAREELGRINRKPGNHAKYEFVAVADVEKWDWWPAKKHVLADLRAIAARNNTPLYADWKGALRKAWGFRRGQSVIVLVGRDGKALFVGEGTLSEAQLAALVGELRRVGADVD